MAKVSKQRPFVVELQPPGMTEWAALDAYRDSERADSRQ